MSYLLPERRYDSPSYCYMCASETARPPQRQGVKPLVPVGHDQGVVRLSQLALYLCLLPPVIAFSKGLVVAPQPYLSAPLYRCEYGNREWMGPQQQSPLLGRESRSRHVKTARRFFWVGGVEEFPDGFFCQQKRARSTSIWRHERSR